MNLKRIKSILVLGSILLFFFTTTIAQASELKERPSTQVEKRYKTHTVNKGETVYSISKLYNVPIVDLYLINPGIENGLKTGADIKIPYDVNSNISQNSSTHNYNEVHEYYVKPKETLYSICKANGVSIESMVAANPELNEKPLYIGQRLVIPLGQVTAINDAVMAKASDQQQQHIVQPKETLYGIARQYNTTPEAIIAINPSLQDGLKQGAIILIPAASSQQAAGLSSPVSTLQDVNGLNIGIVLPFLNKSEAQTARFLEYYEGFLLALKDLKASGLSANVYVFDMGSETGTDKLRSLLDTYEMKSLDMIIGGVSPEQIAMMSTFAQKNGIKYVIPFPTKRTNVQDNNQIFQVNMPPNKLFSSVSAVFRNKIGSANVIFISGDNNDKKEFTSVLNNDLSNSGVRSKTIANNQNLATNLASAMDPTRNNVIIPISGSSQMLQSVLTALSTINGQNSGLNVSLFGYPEWQTYHQFSNDLAKYDSYFYSPFYANEKDYKATRFVQDYKKWYNNKSLINTYPRYGMLGYDTGLYFLSAYKNYGKNFQNMIQSLKVPTLQTSFSFDKVNPNGGYVNNGFYLIHYKPDGSIDKIEYSK